MPPSETKITTLKGQECAAWGGEETAGEAQINNGWMTPRLALTSIPYQLANCDINPFLGPEKTKFLLISATFFGLKFCGSIFELVKFFL